MSIFKLLGCKCSCDQNDQFPKSLSNFTLDINAIDVLWQDNLNEFNHQQSSIKQQNPQDTNSLNQSITSISKRPPLLSLNSRIKNQNNNANNNTQVYINIRIQISLNIKESQIMSDDVLYIWQIDDIDNQYVPSYLTSLEQFPVIDIGQQKSVIVEEYLSLQSGTYLILYLRKKKQNQDFPYQQNILHEELDSNSSTQNLWRVLGKSQNFEIELEELDNASVTVYSNLQSPVSHKRTIKFNSSQIHTPKLQTQRLFSQQMDVVRSPQQLFPSQGNTKELKHTNELLEESEYHSINSSIMSRLQIQNISTKEDENSRQYRFLQQQQQYSDKKQIEQKLEYLYQNNNNNNNNNGILNESNHNNINNNNYNFSTDNSFLGINEIHRLPIFSTKSNIKNKLRIINEQYQKQSNNINNNNKNLQITKIL